MFGDMFGVGFSVLQEVHGETVTYTPDGGAGVSITALWRPRGVEADYNTDGEQQRKDGEIECSLDDVTAASDRDTFTISSVVYRVERVTSTHPTVVADLVKLTDRTIGSLPKARG